MYFSVPYIHKRPLLSQSRRFRPAFINALCFRRVVAFATYAFISCCPVQNQMPALQALGFVFGATKNLEEFFEV